MDIKEIALNETKRMQAEGWAIGDSSGVVLVERVIAEIAKQNEPVAWWNGKETAFFEHETDGPVGEVKIPLYTYPPTAEQIANETAEACAKYVNRFINGDGILNEVWISDIESALRNGEWRKYMKGE